MQLFARTGKVEFMEMPLPVKGWNRQSVQSEGCALFKSLVKSSGTQVYRHCL